MTTTQKKTAGVAITSLILGILGLMCLGPLGSIPAIICGHIGLSTVKKNPETLQGDGMALAGLIMGYIQIALLILFFVVILIPAVAGGLDKAHAVVCTTHMQKIEAAKDTLAMKEGLGDFSEVDVQAVNEILGGNLESSCPEGGVIEYSPIGVSPSCSVHGPLYQVLKTIDE